MVSLLFVDLKGVEKKNELSSHSILDNDKFNRAVSYKNTQVATDWLK